MKKPYPQDDITERARQAKESEGLLDRLLGGSAFDLLTRAKESRREESKHPFERKVAARGNKIPFELLNQALGYTPEFVAWLKEERRKMTPAVERQKRRARNKRAKASRQRNQQRAAAARRTRQKRRDTRRAA